MTLLAAGGPRPYAVAAYVLWGLAVIAIGGGVAWLIASRRREGESSLAAVGIVTLGALVGLLGVAAFFARPGGTAVPGTGPTPAAAGTLTPTLSPVPTAPDAPQQVAPQNGGGASPAPAEPVEIGFEAIGAVEIGSAKTSIESTFGKPAGTVDTVAPDGKPATSYAYESGARDFEIFVRDGKVIAYAVRSPGFTTFSGVAVGDTVDKLKQAYPTKLQKESETAYSLSGPRGSAVRFNVDDGKVVRIDGGRLG